MATTKAFELGQLSNLLDIDASGNINFNVTNDINFDANTLYVDADTNRVGIGTTTPTERLQVYENTAGLTRVAITNDEVGGLGAAEIDIRSDVARAIFGIYGSNYGGTLFGLPHANMAAFFTSGVTPPSRFIMGTRSDIPYQIATNDQLRITVDGSGNVGIGTTDPVFPLQVNGGFSAGRGVLQRIELTGSSSDNRIVGESDPLAPKPFRIFTGSNSTWLQFYTVSEQPIIFNTNNNEVVRIDATGKVGIGTSNPSAFGNFAVVGDVNSVGNSAGWIIKRSRTDNTFKKGFYDPDGFGSLAIYTADSERIRIDSAGRITVGHTSPISFANNAVTPAFNLIGTTQDSTSFSNIRYSNSSGAQGSLRLMKSRSTVIGQYAVVNNGDRLGTLSYLGDNGSDFVSAASVDCVVDGTVNGDMPGALILATTPVGGNNPTEKVRVTSAGNVGIGTSSPGSKLAVNGLITESTDSTNYYPVVTQQDIGTAPNEVPLNQYLGNLAYQDAGHIAGNVIIGNSLGIRKQNPTAALDVAGKAAVFDNVLISRSTVAPGLTFLNSSFGLGTAGISYFDTGSLIVTTNSIEAMRIDSSGKVLVGKTTNVAGEVNEGILLFNTGRLGVTHADSWSWFSRTNSNGDVLKFHRGTTTAVGSISVTTTATAYNTSSDYRLKNVDGPLTNSGTYIDSLKPVQGTWKANNEKFIGLIAHEAQEVSQTQVATGEKDGEEMQSMDYGNPEFIANIIAELQSLRKRVAELEAK